MLYICGIYNQWQLYLYCREKHIHRLIGKGAAAR